MSSPQYSDAPGAAPAAPPRGRNPYVDPAARDQLRARLDANGRRLQDHRAVQVLRLRAGLDDGRPRSVREVAALVKVSFARVYQIEKAALAVLEQRPDAGPYRGDLPALDQTHAGLDAAEPKFPSAPADNLPLLVGRETPLTSVQARTLLLAQLTRTGHRLRQLIASWLATKESANTRASYLRDISQYLDYCIEHNLDPLSVRVPEFDMYTVWLQMRPGAAGGTSYAPSTRARKISVISSFYSYLVKVEAADRNPVTRDARPKPDDFREDKTLTRDETLAIIADAESGHQTLGPTCASLVVEMLFTLGIRVSEICSLNLDQLSWVEREGRRFRAIKFVGKGNKRNRRAIPEQLDQNRLTPYLAQRPQPASARDGAALLLTLDGKRLRRNQVYQLVMRAYRRGIVNRKVTPHFGRHTFNQRAFEARIPIEIRRQALNHKSIVTTEGYGHTHMDLAADPSHAVCALLYAHQAGAA